jgi:Protein of unknown function (DUF4058)
MPVHDWTRVEAGIFHAFHHDWITDLSRALNRGLLPKNYYALPEQYAAGFGPDVLALELSGGAGSLANASSTSEDSSEAGGLLVAAPKLVPTAETDLEFYRRKQKAVVIRHVTGDRIVAMVEIVSPGNKSTVGAMRSFVEKATWLLERRVHLLIIDLLPPGPRDPQGVHAAIWDDFAGQAYTQPPDKPLTLAAYETALSTKAYVRAVAVGDALGEMPLFLEPNACVEAPLEATYQTAFAAMPHRWRRVLEPANPRQ